MELENRLTVLEAELRRQRDQFEIQQIIASYGPLVDTAEGLDRARNVAELWTEDGVYDVGGFGARKGRDEIARGFEGIHFEQIPNGVCHVMGLPVISIVEDIFSVYRVRSECRRLTSSVRDNRKADMAVPRISYFGRRLLQSRWRTPSDTRNWSSMPKLRSFGWSSLTRGLAPDTGASGLALPLSQKALMRGTQRHRRDALVKNRLAMKRSRYRRQRNAVGQKTQVRVERSIT